MKKMINKMVYPINEDFQEFNAFLEKNLHSSVNIINSITKYLIKYKLSITITIIRQSKF